jgi:DNA-binding transcriptional LysR family regulator
MLLAQIQSFVAVARAGNVTRAAEELFVSQPTLTGRLKSLENELGVVLLHRTTRGVRLTEAGLAYLPHAERILSAAADGARTLTEVRQGGGVLTVAVAPMVTFTVLPDVVRQFRERQSRMTLSIRTMTSGDVTAALLRGDAELGIARDIRHPDLERVVLYDDRLMLIVDPGHRLASAKSVRVEDLSDEEFVLFDRSYGYRELTTALLGGTTVMPRGVVKVDSFGAVTKMVQAGLGVGIVPQSAAVELLEKEAVRALRVIGGKRVHLTMVALRRRGAGPASAAVKELIALLQTAGKRAGARSSRHLK